MIASNSAPTASAPSLKILHLEDSEVDHALVCRALRQRNDPVEITRVETLADFEMATRGIGFDMILADYRLPGFTALDAWALLQNTSTRPPFILLSGAIGESAAVSAVHLGISDYLHKGELDKLWRVIDRALEVHQTRLAKEKASHDLEQSQLQLARFADHLQTTIENERASIAREIHDDIGGSLAAVKLDLAWLARHTTAPESLSHLATATEMLQHALGASQRIMMDLRPAILDQGLFAALQWLASGFEKRTGIKTHLSTNNEQIHPSRAVQLTAYRTTQEALTNASKYAGATEVHIELSDAEDFLTVEIRDCGTGLSAEDLHKPGSFGIRGLRERAKSVGGWLDVSSRPGSGTSIILSVPLSQNHDSAREDPFQ
jgi:two-component system, NarL family, sensor histidine kinase UhpB